VTGREGREEREKIKVERGGEEGFYGTVLPWNFFGVWGRVVGVPGLRDDIM
jgi:hypothetical protein